MTKTATETVKNETMTTTAKITTKKMNINKRRVYTETSRASIMSRTRKEFCNTDLGDKENQSANERLSGVYAVDLYVQNGNTAAQV